MSSKGMIAIKFATPKKEYDNFPNRSEWREHVKYRNRWEHHLVVYTLRYANDPAFLIQAAARIVENFNKFGQAALLGNYVLQEAGFEVIDGLFRHPLIFDKNKPHFINSPAFILRQTTQFHKYNMRTEGFTNNFNAAVAKKEKWIRKRLKVPKDTGKLFKELLERHVLVNDVVWDFCLDSPGAVYIDFSRFDEIKMGWHCDPWECREEGIPKMFSMKEAMELAKKNHELDDSYAKFPKVLNTVKKLTNADKEQMRNMAKNISILGNF